MFTAFLFATAFAVDAQTLDAFNPNADVTVSDVEILADGKILVCGQFTTIGGQARRALARLNADGTLDTTFPAIDFAFQNLLDTIIQPDGKILISGGFSTINGVTRIRVARLNQDGTLDTSFNAGLIAPVGVSRMALQADGKILIPAAFTGSSTVLRRNSDGSADTSFASRTFNGTIAQVVVQPDGKVLAVGSFTSVDGVARGGIARLNADGSFDATFNANINSGGAVFLMTLAPDGKIYAGGSFTSIGGQTRTYFARLNADGSADTGFQTPLIAAATTAEVRPSVLLPNGKIIIGGTFDTIGGAARKQLARLNADGSLDTNFRDMSVGTGGSGSPATLKLQTDGKLLVGGNFTTVDGQPRNRLARITMNDVAAPIVSPFDFDGDGKSDLSVFRGANQNWYVNRSSNNQFSAVSFGISSDKIVPADFDGDGKTDIAVWRENSGNPDLSYFYILQSSNNVVRVEQFGSTGDNPGFVGDWDGDGRSDPAVYRASTNSFYYRPSASAANFVAINWGAVGDVPMNGDFDGDGKQDAAIFRASNSNWYIRRSSDLQLRVENWGLSSDKFVPADYDGDGKTDLAVYRGGIWYIKQSTNNALRTENFGIESDLPVPADYDGDGRDDLSVYRGGIWYLLQSTSGFSSAAFGQSGDQPIPNVFVR